MGVEEHTIELSGSPVFYREASAPRPVASRVLYLHGVPTSSDDWLPFLQQTGGIAPDLLGFGRSAKGGHLDYTPDGLGRFVEELLQRLGVERFTLVGHDWGGAIALLLAQRRPQQLERLVLINAVPLLDGFRWHGFARAWRTRGVGELAMGATGSWLLARTLRRGTVSPDAWSRQRLDAVWHQFDQGTQRAILRLYRAAPESWLTGAGLRIGEIRCPALVVWGTRDPWLPASLGERYAEVLAAARLEPVVGAGHWPWLDQPATIDSVVEFVSP